MLLLGHYRNRLVHLFFDEAVWACAYYSLGHERTLEHGVARSKLFGEATFLYKLLHRELIRRDDRFELEGSFSKVLFTKDIFGLMVCL
jgi:glycerol-3-phosphate O-acyltransferase